MSIYTSEIAKPTTHICNLQPKDIFAITNGGTNTQIPNVKPNVTNNEKNIKKPIAYISPIEILNLKDQAIQTDSISIDMNSVINIHDFRRSERLMGILDELSLNPPEANCELVSAQEKIKSLEDSLKQQLKNNDDIKKLLIASLGDDLAAQFLKLTR